MATGWARDGAVRDQIDASVEDAVELARSRLPRGEGERDDPSPTGCYPAASPRGRAFSGS